MPRAAPSTSTTRRARRTNPMTTPPPAYSPTIDLTVDKVIDLTADTDTNGEFVPFSDDAQRVINHMFRHPHPYRHTRHSLPSVALHTRYERRVTCSQTRQAPTARDLLALAKIANQLPPSFTGITLRDAHDLAHGIASAMRRDPQKYGSLRQLNQDVQEIWQELAE